MTVFNTISGSMVGLLVLLLIGGAVMGLSVSGTDIVNPNTSEAEAERIRAETEHTREMERLAEGLEQAKTEAQINSIRLRQEADQGRFTAEMEYIEQLNAAKVEAYGRLTRVGDNLLLLFGATASLCAILLSARRWGGGGGRGTPAVQPSPKARPTGAALREDAVQHAIQGTRREQARKNEQTWRAAQIMMARMKAARDPGSFSKEEHDSLPIAG
jgi:hypothetical protein